MANNKERRKPGFKGLPEEMKRSQLIRFVPAMKDDFYDLRDMAEALNTTKSKKLLALILKFRGREDELISLLSKKKPQPEPQPEKNPWHSFEKPEVAARHLKTLNLLRNFDNDIEDVLLNMENLPHEQKFCMTQCLYFRKMRGSIKQVIAELS